jgi:hypothetical protein
VLFEKYVYEGDGKFQYEFIDPNKDPIASQDAGITKDGSVVLYMGDSKQAVSIISEEELTGAMVRLLNPGKHVIYFLTGHGEYSIDASGDQSYSQLKSDLEAKNYTVSSLNLLANPQIPQDASVIVIAGPQKQLSDSEVSLLDEYIKMVAQWLSWKTHSLRLNLEMPLTLASYSAQTIGIVLGMIWLLMQVAQSMQQPFVAIANQYVEHPITENERNGVYSRHPECCFRRFCN